jgi:uncharacterized membrane protein
VSRTTKRGRVPRQKSATLVAVAVAVAFAAPAVGAAAPASLASKAAGARTSCAASVTIAGKRVCLAAGKTCKRKYESKYQSKGFTCKSAKGGFRLKRMKQGF